MLLVPFLLSTSLELLTLEMALATKDITVLVNGEVFRCPNDLTADQAVTSIRTFYGLQFGGLQAGGVLLLGSQRIESTVEALSFVGGLQTQQGKSAVFC